MGYTIAAFSTGLGTELVTETCCSCGVNFAITGEFYNQRRKDHGWFYCPNGHRQHYMGENADQRKIRELTAARDRAESARKWAESAAKGARIAAGKAKAETRRITARVHAGVCPHCRRTFKQLAAHMKSKHQCEIQR